MTLIKRLEKIWLQITVVCLYFAAMIVTIVVFSMFTHYLLNLFWLETLFSGFGLAFVISVIFFLDKACTALNLNY